MNPTIVIVLLIILVFSFIIYISLLAMGIDIFTEFFSRSEVVFGGEVNITLMLIITAIIIISLVFFVLLTGEGT